MNVQCIILARGGSKGILQKNIKDFSGKPLLAWTIEQCLDAKSVTDVWVSSDDQQILDVANASGARLIKRPDNISSDEATSESGWLHAIKKLELNGIDIDAVLAPQVTSPVRGPKDIDLAIEKFRIEKLDSLFSYTNAEDLYFWEKSIDGVMNSINYDYKNRKKRQNFQKQIIENGSFYLFKPEILRAECNRLGGKIGHYEMECWKMFEIDNPDDWSFVELIFRKYLLSSNYSETIKNN